MARAEARSGSPAERQYWLWFSSMARTAAVLQKSGVGQSGKPCPRLTACICAARGVNSCHTVGFCAVNEGIGNRYQHFVSEKVCHLRHDYKAEGFEACDPQYDASTFHRTSPQSL